MAVEWTDPPPVDVPGLPVVAAPGARGAAPRWHYTPALGEWIAELYGDAQAAAEAAPGAPQDNAATRGLTGGLWGLHYAMPDRIPPPGIVRAWCRQFPGFGLLMREAEKLRAESLMEQAVTIADHDPAPAPRVALRIATRQRMAERLDPGKWGDGRTAPGESPATLARQGAQPLALEASDEELARIALGGAAGATVGAGEGEPPAGERDSAAAGAGEG